RPCNSRRDLPLSAGYMPVRRLLGWPDPGQVALSGLIGILLAFYAARFLLPLLAPQAPRADDFQDYLFAAQQIAAGGDPYANFIHNHVPWDWSLSSGYLYPPAFAVTLIPLTWVSNDLAVGSWSPRSVSPALVGLQSVSSSPAWTTTSITSATCCRTWRPEPATGRTSPSPVSRPGSASPPRRTRAAALVGADGCSTGR